MRRLELIQPCDFRIDDGARSARCEGCGHEVVNLSAMNAVEALETLARRARAECVHFELDGSDRVVFADGPRDLVGAIAKDARPLVTVASMILAACSGGGETSASAKPVPSAETSSVSVSSATSAAAVEKKQEVVEECTGMGGTPVRSSANASASVAPSVSSAKSGAAPLPKATAEHRKLAGKPMPPPNDGPI